MLKRLKVTTSLAAMVVEATQKDLEAPGISVWGAEAILISNLAAMSTYAMNAYRNF